MRRAKDRRLSPTPDAVALGSRPTLKKKLNAAKSLFPRAVNVFSRFCYKYKRVLKIARLYLLIAGPGIIVVVADNDAGSITTYSTTGAQYGFHLIWFLILLGPVAYYVQEMTTKHDETGSQRIHPIWVQGAPSGR